MSLIEIIEEILNFELVKRKIKVVFWFISVVEEVMNNGK